MAEAETPVGEGMSLAVMCPTCHSTQPVEMTGERTGRIIKHVVTTCTWSAPHANGHRTAVDIDQECVGSEAVVRVSPGLDRRNA